MLIHSWRLSLIDPFRSSGAFVDNFVLGNRRAALGRHQQVEFDRGRPEAGEQALGLVALQAVFGSEFVKAIGATAQDSASALRFTDLRHW